LTGPCATVTSLFFMWGFITVLVGALIPRLKEVFELSYLQAGLVQSAWFAAYGMLSIPGGQLIERIGYQRGILVGLACAAAGCLLFHPAAGTRLYSLFLLALFVVAGGIAMLQVAANPYIAVLGRPEGASSRLNLASAFNSLGSTIAPIISGGFLLGDSILTSEQQAALSTHALETYREKEAGAVQGPFVTLAGLFIVLALLIGMSNLPTIKGERGANDTRIPATYLSVMGNQRLMLGALGIFFYVGAEVALGSYAVNYGLALKVDKSMQESVMLSALARSAAVLKGTDLKGMSPAGMINTLLTFYWGGAMIGRFMGSGLMSLMPPNKVLGFCSAAAVMMVGLSISLSGVPALLAILMVGLFNSVMFPTIFALAIEELGNAKPQGSGILCTAIMGGAIIPPIVGMLIDLLGFGYAFCLPLLCYVYISWYGFYGAGAKADVKSV